MNSDLSSLTGLESGFEFCTIPKTFPAQNLGRYCSRIKQQYSNISTQWGKQANSEWTVRHYLAVKAVLAATLMLNSLEHALSHNLRIVEPYLIYYSIFTSGRALLLTLPNQPWANGKLARPSHKLVLDKSFETVSSISSVVGARVGNILKLAKGYRELFSYRFPATGMGVLPDDHRVTYTEAVELCSLLCELAQLNSELFQVCLGRDVTGAPGLDTAVLNQGMEYDIPVEFYDSEDAYRLVYFERHESPYPVNLCWTMRPGLVEDFFGAWLREEDNGDATAFDPDQNWQLIFSMPM